MINKKQSLVVKGRRSVSDFFNRSQEVFERKFDGFPAVVEGPSRSAATNEVPDLPPLDISGYLTQDVPPCPDDNGECTECAETEPILGGCEDLFDREESTTWGTSTIMCLPWGQSSTGGNRSVTGGKAYQTAGSGTPLWFPANYLDLTAWDGGALEFVIEGFLLATGSRSLIAFKSTASNSFGPINDNSRSFRWTIGRLGNGNVGLSLFATAGGQVGSAINGDTGVPDTVPVDVRCRLETDVIRIKGWESGTTEPGSWTLSTSPVSPVFLGSLGLGGANIFSFTTIVATAGTSEIESLRFVSGLSCEDTCGSVETCDCSGATVLSRLIAVGGVWSPSEMVGPVNYYTNVWFDGLPAVKDIDYNVVDGTIVPISELDESTVVKARYVIR